jgi:hypothetical protein
METRQVTQVKLYKLWLHPISSSSHTVALVAIAYDKQKMIDFYNDQLEAESYQDLVTPAGEVQKGPSIVEQEAIYVTKYFKKGSHLENFDPCDITKYDTETDIGINAGWTTQEHIDTQMATLNKKIIFIDKEQ